MIRHMGSLFISEPKRLASLTVTKDSRQPFFTWKVTHGKSEFRKADGDEGRQRSMAEVTSP
jgi:hypothetical protein